MTAKVVAIPGVSGRLHGLLDSESPYLDRARARARQYANRRGLMNSSIAAGAGETAAIDAALPIAQADAGIAAGERGWRSQEHQQAQEHRVQQLMQERGLSHDEAQRQADREQQTSLQQGSQEFQSGQSELNREASRIAQEKGITHEAALAEAQRGFNYAAVRT